MIKAFYILQEDRRVKKNGSKAIFRYSAKICNERNRKYTKVSNEDVEVFEGLIRLIKDEELKEELYKIFNNAKELEDMEDIISTTLPNSIYSVEAL